LIRAPMDVTGNGVRIDAPQILLTSYGQPLLSDLAKREDLPRSIELKFVHDLPAEYQEVPLAELIPKLYSDGVVPITWFPYAMVPVFRLISGKIPYHDKPFSEWLSKHVLLYPKFARGGLEVSTSIESLAKPEDAYNDMPTVIGSVDLTDLEAMYNATEESDPALWRFVTVGSPFTGNALRRGTGVVIFRDGDFPHVLAWDKYDLKALTTTTNEGATWRYTEVSESNYNMYPYSWIGQNGTYFIKTIVSLSSSNMDPFNIQRSIEAFFAARDPGYKPERSWASYSQVIVYRSDAAIKSNLPRDDPSSEVEDN